MSDFLDSDLTPDACYNITSAHGLMTGIVIGPEIITPSRWLPVLLGETEDQSVQYISLKHAEKIHDLIFRMYNRIVRQFEVDAGGFRPLLESRGETSREAIYNSMKDWCSGFLETVIMELEAWEELTEDPDHAWLLDIPLSFGTSEGRKDARKLTEEQLHENARLLPEILEAIYLYWLERRVPPEDLFH